MLEKKAHFTYDIPTTSYMYRNVAWNQGRTVAAAIMLGLCLAKLVVDVVESCKTYVIKGLEHIDALETAGHIAREKVSWRYTPLCQAHTCSNPLLYLKYKSRFVIG